MELGISHWRKDGLLCARGTDSLHWQIRIAQTNFHGFTLNISLQKCVHAILAEHPWKENLQGKYWSCWQIISRQLCQINILINKTIFDRQWRNTKPDMNDLCLLCFRHSYLQSFVSNFPRMKWLILGTYGSHSWIPLSQMGNWQQKTRGSFSSLLVPTGHQSSTKKDGGVGGGRALTIPHTGLIFQLVSIFAGCKHNREGPWAPHSGAQEVLTLLLPTAASPQPASGLTVLVQQEVACSDAASSSVLGKTLCTSSSPLSLP